MKIMTDSSEGSQMEAPESCLGLASIYLESFESETEYICQSQNAWHFPLFKIPWSASAILNLFLLAVGLPLSFLVFPAPVCFPLVSRTGAFGDWRLGLLVWGFSVLPDLLEPGT